MLLTGSLLLATFAALLGTSVIAAPGVPSGDQALNQNVDYLSPESAATLDLDFPVLVPSSVPGPFGGEPSVSGGGGSYSLYWMNAGGAPTLLEITGMVGGTLPAGSLNDLNNELSVNATVQSQEAIQDLTSNYDAVYWVANGVLYKVESQNMPMGSLSLANSLISFIAPQAQAPEVEVPVEELPPDAGGGILETPTDVPDLPDEAAEPSQDGDVEPVATSDVVEEAADTPEAVPDITVEAAAEPTAQPVQPESGTTVDVQEGQAPAAAVEPTAAAQEDETPEPVDAANEADLGSDASVEPSTAASGVGSDGTGGAPLPVFGGDGTGGTRDLVVP